MNSEHRIAQALLRLWPFPRGAGRLLDKYFGGVRFRHERAIVRTTDGFDISVEPNDLIGRHLYLTGEFDRSIVEIICDFAKPGDVLLDIGANIGYVSACFLNNVPGSTAIAIECQPVILELLKSNLAQFGRSQIYPFALGDRDGQAWMEIDNLNKAASQVVEHAGGHRIEMRSAERMFSDLKIEKIDIVKLDVEGCEESVIRSCLKQLDQLRPRAIIFEDHLGDDRGSVVKLLNSIGYKSYGIKKYLTKLKLRPVSTVEDCRDHDYIAISNWQSVPIKAKELYGLADRKTN